MNTQIIYVAVSSDKDVFLEELWVSVYSLRIYNPEATVKVLADAPTAVRIEANKKLRGLLTEVVIVPVPEHYTPKERSRQIKTTIREFVEGAFFYIDTDTVICKSLDEIDAFNYDVAGVPDGNISLADNPFGQGMADTVKRIFGSDVSRRENLINGGVLFVSDTPIAHELFKRWNENWKYSCFEKGNSQDQPALWHSDHEMGNVIKTIPHIYNSQVAMSLAYFADAAIVHFLHMPFIPDQSYSPYLSLKIYKELKKAGTITPEIAELIRGCKSTFASPSMPVGVDQILFLFTPMGKTLVQIYKDGGAASWLMMKMSVLLAKIHKYTRKK